MAIFQNMKANLARAMENSRKKADEKAELNRKLRQAYEASRRKAELEAMQKYAKEKIKMEYKQRLIASKPKQNILGSTLANIKVANPPAPRKQNVDWIWRL